MLIASGIVALLLGLIAVVGQAVSTLDFELAQRLGLQERDDETEPLYRALELNTARVDLIVLWTLPAAGVLMLLDHAWWPYAAIAAGGVHVDAGCREVAKLLGLRGQGVSMGAPGERRTALAFNGILAAAGLWALCYGLVVAT